MSIGSGVYLSVSHCVFKGTDEDETNKTMNWTQKINNLESLSTSDTLQSGKQPKIRCWNIRLSLHLIVSCELCHVFFLQKPPHHKTSPRKWSHQVRQMRSWQMRSWSLQRARLQAIPCQVKPCSFSCSKLTICPLDLVLSCPYLTVFLKRLMYAIWPGWNKEDYENFVMFSFCRNLHITRPAPGSDRIEWDRWGVGHCKGLAFKKYLARSRACYFYFLMFKA